VGSLAQLTLSLLVVVGLIFAAAWLLKRLKLAGPRAGTGTGTLAVIDQLVLGPRERIVLVRVGEGQVLLGIGAGGLVPLTPLATPIACETSGAGASISFAERLREFVKRPGGGA
jgi:flagellar protein FliO/FliZ